MPYTHFRYIAYQVPTVVKNAANQAVYGIPAGQAREEAMLDAIPNLPVLKTTDFDLTTLDIDIRIRMKRLLGVMTYAHNFLKNAAGRDNDRTLKILITPEFYFRPINAEVSYSHKQYLQIKDVLHATISQESRFDDWLIIPGTILWDHVYDKVNNKRIFRNTALCIYRNGKNKPDFFEKIIASRIDGVPTGRHGRPVPTGSSAANNASTDEAWPGFYNSFQQRKQRVFKIGGIQIGVEICLEHGLRILGNTLNEGVRNGTFLKNSVQLQLLLAGGMSVKEQNIATDIGGFILRTDGYNGGTPALQSNMHRIREYIGWNANLAPSNRDVAGDKRLISHTIEIDNQHPLALPFPSSIIGSNRLSWFAQRIKLYRPQLIL